MTRTTTIRTSKYPYHIVNRCHRKAPFPIPLNDVWNLFIYELEKVQKEENLTIYAFVLMPNHFHLLCQTPKSNIDKVMYKLMKRLTYKIQIKAEIINSIFGGRYKSSLVRDQNYYYNVYKYVLQNPLRAKLSHDFLKYPFLLCSEKANKTAVKITKFVDCTSREDQFSSWINTSFCENDHLLIQKAMKKRIYQYPKNQGYRQNPQANFTQ
ncbi:transposase [Halobacteriovorax sp. GB3]|uniref:transposase n=1 Tax=Halobacteriovorax sp. GB3 TaxID=2719615 RepID=UPI002362CF7C|nr:transposase [Halobacteriovorax sp. GB3]MDD0852559.1 transposase [Halobacteriovorax sp. GB3]